jgi:hypothetical protein
VNLHADRRGGDAGDGSPARGDGDDLGIGAGRHSPGQDFRSSRESRDGAGSHVGRAKHAVIVVSVILNVSVVPQAFGLLEGRVTENRRVRGIDRDAAIGAGRSDTDAIVRGEAGLDIGLEVAAAEEGIGARILKLDACRVVAPFLGKDG